MLFFWKKSRLPRNRGSFLIEALASVVVLSVGILAIMEVFATQRMAAATNQQKTRELFLVADHLGAVLSGVTLDGFDVREGKEFGTVKVLEELLDDDKAGLKEMALLFEGGASKKKGMMVLTYVKDEAAAL